jgi:hypothetical protein
VAILLGQTLRHHEGRKGDRYQISHNAIRAVFAYLKEHNLNADVADLLFRQLVDHADSPLATVSLPIPIVTLSRVEMIALAESARRRFRRYRRTQNPDAEVNWICGELRSNVIGRVAMAEVSKIVAGVLANG